jgi:hypothetical protein
VIIIGNGSVWRRRGAYLRRCLLLRRRRRYLLLDRRLIAPGPIAWRLIALWQGAELLRDSGGCLRRRGARRLKLRCRAERLRGQNRLRQRRGTRLRLLLSPSASKASRPASEPTDMDSESTLKELQRVKADVLNARTDAQKASLGSIDAA